MYYQNVSFVCVCLCVCGHGIHMIKERKENAIEKSDKYINESFSFIFFSFAQESVSTILTKFLLIVQMINRMIDLCRSGNNRRFLLQTSFDRAIDIQARWSAMPSDVKEKVKKGLIFAQKNISKMNSRFYRFWLSGYNETIKKFVGFKKHFENWTRTYIIEICRNI